MATEFVCAIRASGGDYTSLAAWQTACVSDLTSATNKVFAHGGIEGSISDGDAVTGVNSNATGTVYHATGDQIYVAVTSGTFESGEQVYETQDTNYVVISDTGDSVIAIADGYNDWPSGLVTSLTLAGWTTSAANYVEVRAADGEGHSGTAADGFRLGHTGTGSPLIRVQIDHFRLTGAILDCSGFAGSTGIYGAYIEGLSGSAVEGDIRLERCVIKGKASAVAQQFGVYVRRAASRTANVVVRLSNLLIYDHDSDSVLVRGGIVVYDNSSPRTTEVYCYNCTIADSNSYGLYGFGPGVLKARNVACVGNTTDYYAYATGSDTVDSDYCASGDTTLAGAPWSDGTHHQTSVSPTWADQGNDDYHIQAGDTALQDLGTDLSSDPDYAIAVDIDNVTRSGSWDIGADEYAPVTEEIERDWGDGAGASDAWVPAVSRVASVGDGAAASDAWVATYDIPVPTTIYINDSSEGAQSGDVRPTGITDRTPVMSAYVSGAGAPLDAYRWQVATDKAFDSADLVYDSETVELGESIPSSGGRLPDHEYGTH